MGKNAKSIKYQIQEILNSVYDESNGVIKTDLEVESIDVDVEGSVAHDAADAGNPLKNGGRASAAQIAAVSNDDRTDAIYNLYGEMVNAGFTWATNSNRIEEVDPLDQKFVGETIANASSQGDGTTYYYFDMAGFKTFGLQIEDAPGGAGDETYTFEATLQDDGTAAASCTYQDVTNDMFGVASAVTDDMWMADLDTPIKYGRVKVVRANDGGATDGAWIIYLKKMY
jgi:YHS domain-containing protein